MASDWFAWVAGGLLALLAGAIVFGNGARAALVSSLPDATMSTSPGDPTTEPSTVAAATASTESSPTATQNPYESDGGSSSSTTSTSTRVTGVTDSVETASTSLQEAIISGTRVYDTYRNPDGSYTFEGD